MSPDSPDRRSTLAQFLLAGLALGGSRLALGNQGAAPSFGIVPYLPSRRLFELYNPLLPVFSKVLGGPVDISSAADYRQHISLIRAGNYDIVADSLFISRIAQREHGHIPLLRTKVGLEVIIVVPKASASRSLQDLAGKSICLTDRTAALGVIGLQFLRSRGLPPDDKVRVVRSGSHQNSLELMLAGHAAAAIVSKTTLAQVSPETAQSVRILATPPAGLASVVYHVHPRLAKQAQPIREALLSFANTADGKRFIDSLGHKGLVPVTDAEMKSLDPAVVEFYRQL
ncbi:MAG: hypothetical protein RLZZ271_906 [Pseudomonadota bacterium]|jgi:ABC-type phosphate/phosphonate transport system substrate-binding protein